MLFLLICQDSRKFLSSQNHIRIRRNVFLFKFSFFLSLRHTLNVSHLHIFTHFWLLHFCIIRHIFLSFLVNLGTLKRPDSFVSGFTVNHLDKSNISLESILIIPQNVILIFYSRFLPLIFRQQYDMNTYSFLHCSSTKD